MISKRRKNATLRKNQKKRSNQRSKKFQMRGGSGANSTPGIHGICFKDDINEKFELFKDYRIGEWTNTNFLTGNVQNERVSELAKLKKNLDEIVSKNAELYTPELFKTYITDKIEKESPIFKTYCYLGYDPAIEVHNPLDPSILLTNNYNSGIQPTLDEYEKAGFIILDLLRCGVMFSTMNNDSQTKIRTYMEDSENQSALIYIINKLQSHGFDLTKLKNMGFTASLLKEAGFSATDLKKAEFSISKLKEAGFTLDELQNGVFTIKELLESNQFSVRELMDAKLDRNEVLKYELIKLKKLYTDLNDEKQKPYLRSNDKDRRHRAKQKLYNDFIKPIIENLIKLKDAGFKVRELFNANIPLTDLKQAGFTVQELKDDGFTLEQLLTLTQIGTFDLNDLKTSYMLIPKNYDLDDLKNSYMLIPKNYDLDTIFKLGKYKFGDIKKICDELQQQNTNMISLESKEKEQLEKITDFDEAPKQAKKMINLRYVYDKLDILHKIKKNLEEINKKLEMSAEKKCPYTQEHWYKKKYPCEYCLYNETSAPLQKDSCNEPTSSK